MKNGPIDLVIPWVNGEDPQWQQKAAPYLSVKDFGSLSIGKDEEIFEN
ncbi:Stealth CR1 domain-containing protein [Ligilactobacillus aviarius]|nr:Stealth CR1 domain-containing protein [Ligilactobacillus aviarius]